MSGSVALPDQVYLDVGDFLKEHRVFRSGFDNSRVSDPGSYMSTMDFPSFDACKAELWHTFGRDGLLQTIHQFRNVWGYLSPTFLLAALVIENFVSQAERGVLDGKPN